jgi:hypothetical protein
LRRVRIDARVDVEADAPAGRERRITRQSRLVLLNRDRRHDRGLRARVPKPHLRHSDDRARGPCARRARGCGSATGALAELEGPARVPELARRPLRVAPRRHINGDILLIGPRGSRTCVEEPLPLCVGGAAPVRRGQVPRAPDGPAGCSVGLTRTPWRMMSSCRTAVGRPAGDALRRAEQGRRSVRGVGRVRRCGPWPTSVDLNQFRFD